MTITTFDEWVPYHIRARKEIHDMGLTHCCSGAMILATYLALQDGKTVDSDAVFADMLAGDKK